MSFKPKVNTKVILQTVHGTVVSGVITYVATTSSLFYLSKENKFWVFKTEDIIRSLEVLC